MAAPQKNWPAEADGDVYLLAQVLQRTYAKLVMGIECVGLTSLLSELQRSFEKVEAWGAW
jgi:hypothetical protein